MKNSRKIQSPHLPLARDQACQRRGVSLFEVIASITLLTIVILPVASMTRSSARMLQKSQTVSGQQLIRSTVRWIREDIASVQSVSLDSLVYTRKSTAASPIEAAIFVRGDHLLFRSGGVNEVLLENVSEFSLTEGLPGLAPNDGFSIAIAMTDADTGEVMRYQAMIDTSTPLSDGR